MPILQPPKQQKTNNHAAWVFCPGCTILEDTGLRIFFKSFFSLLAFACMLLFIWVEYLSPDAQYMRDNALYVANRMYDAGILEERPDTLVYHASPLPVNMNKLLVDVEGWTMGYIKAAISAEDTTVNARAVNTNPYDTLSRLELKANMDDVQAVYDDVIYCQGVCSPNFPLNGSTASTWSMQTKKLQMAKNGCASEGQICVALFVLMMGTAMCMACSWVGVGGKKEGVFEEAAEAG